MLFALAIGEIARRVVLLLDGTTMVEALPGLAHLGLALVVVATSWVGWANSPANQEWTITRTWSRNFLVLLIDVLLVILYFVLICGAEKPDGQKRVLPSACGETGTVLWIFVGYALWDAMTKLKHPAKEYLKPYLTRTGITWACTLLALVIWHVRAGGTRGDVVLVTDSILLLIVLTFRAFKDKPPVPYLRWVLLTAAIGITLLVWVFPGMLPS